MEQTPATSFLINQDNPFIVSNYEVNDACNSCCNTSVFTSTLQNIYRKQFKFNIQNKPLVVGNNTLYCFDILDMPVNMFTCYISSFILTYTSVLPGNFTFFISDTLSGSFNSSMGCMKMTIPVSASPVTTSNQTFIFASPYSINQLYFMVNSDISTTISAMNLCIDVIGQPVQIL